KMAAAPARQRNTLPAQGALVGGKAFHLEGEERFSAHAKVNSAAAAVDEQRDADDFPPCVLDHVQHFPDGAARGHHVLDDEHPFARSDGKTSPKGHSPSLALGKD